MSNIFRTSDVKADYLADAFVAAALAFAALVMVAL